MKKEREIYGAYISFVEKKERKNSVSGVEGICKTVHKSQQHYTMCPGKSRPLSMFYPPINSVLKMNCVFK